MPTVQYKGKIQFNVKQFLTRLLKVLTRGMHTIDPIQLGKRQAPTQIKSREPSIFKASIKDALLDKKLFDAIEQDVRCGS